MLVLLAACRQLCGETHAEVIHECVELVEVCDDALLFFDRQHRDSDLGQAFTRQTLYLRACHMPAFLRVKGICLQVVRDKLGVHVVMEDEAVVVYRDWALAEPCNCLAHILDSFTHGRNHDITRLCEAELRGESTTNLRDRLLRRTPVTRIDLSVVNARNTSLDHV